MIAWERRQAPDLEAAGVGVALEREQDPPAPDVIGALRACARVPVVPRQLVIGGAHEELALGLVPADEDDERRVVVERLRQALPPPAEEAVVAAELVEVLVDPVGAVELDEEPAVALVICALELDDGIGADRALASVAQP